MTDPDRIIPLDNLPDGFAETVANPPATPAPARPAATIVLLRDGRAGLEVLLMRRSRRAGFVPGAYVFPGGRVDGSDAEDGVLSRVDGLTPDAAARRLGLVGADPPAVAYYLAALREAFEETGILVAIGADGRPAPTASEDRTVDAVREELMEDRLTFADALARLDCRVAGTDVEYVAHWITPRAEPRRYDTRFFAARVPPDAEAIVDPREMTDAAWLTPSEAVGRAEDGSMPMVFPTIHTLERLSRFRSTANVLSDAAERPVRTVLPRLVVTDTGIGMRVDEEE